MKKITGITGLALALSLMSTVAFAGAGHNHDNKPSPDVTLASTFVDGNVSVIMGVGGFAGGNVAVSAGPDGLLMVDDFLPGFAQKLEAALVDLKTCQTCGDLKYLINTHWHFDHVANNEHFGGAAILIAHDAVRPLLNSPQELKAFNLNIPAKNRDGLPDITFAQKSSVYFNGEEIELTHFPQSHTSGDIAAYFKKSNIVHLGDLYFNGLFPFIDLQNGGNVKGMISSIETVIKQYRSDVKIIPGHGALSNIDELKTYLVMLKDTTKAVEMGKNKGLSLEQIQKQGLDKKWQSWAWKFVSTETWIALVYGSL